jgi:hypothetical protein
MGGRSTPSSFFRKDRLMQRYLPCAGPIRTSAMSTTLGAHAGAPTLQQPACCCVPVFVPQEGIRNMPALWCGR